MMSGRQIDRRMVHPSGDKHDVECKIQEPYIFHDNDSKWSRPGSGSARANSM